jgi:hypothetical protein
MDFTSPSWYDTGVGRLCQLITGWIPFLERETISFLPNMDENQTPMTPEMEEEEKKEGEGENGGEQAA